MFKDKKTSFDSPKYDLNIKESFMLSAKQRNYWYHFYYVFGMTRSLTGDWTLPLGYRGGGIHLNETLPWFADTGLCINSIVSQMESLFEFLWFNTNSLPYYIGWQLIIFCPWISEPVINSSVQIANNLHESKDESLK